MRNGDFSSLLALGTRYQIYDPYSTQPAGNGQSLTHEDAATILQEAGGDKNRARQIAQSRGYSF